jgi:hypothetical protein
MEVRGGVKSGGITANRIDLYLHQQGIDTGTPAGKAMFQIMGVFAEFERAMIVERVKAGLSLARSQRKRLGRRPVCPDVVERIREQLTTGSGILKTPGHSALAPERFIGSNERWRLSGHDEAGGRSGDKDADSVRGVRRRKHTGLGDLKPSDYRDDGEPQRHCRAEEAADAVGAALLKDEKCEQHNDRQWQDEAVQHRRRNADAFDGAEHGDCRRDH